MTKTAETASVSEAVFLLHERLGLPQQIEHSESYVRSLHKSWKAAGGSLGGKHRHSDRFLSEQLKARNTSVASLTPKLTGTTRIKSTDARILIQYFLSNWPEESDAADAGTSDVGQIHYEPLLAAEKLDALAKAVADGIGKAPLPVAAESRATVPLLPGEDIRQLLLSLYKEADALFTVGSERAVLPLRRPVELVGFRGLVNGFWTIEQADGKARPLIWVLDMGRQIFFDPESAQRYIAIQELVTRFKALALFEDEKREERMAWLQSRAVFVVLDTRAEQSLDLGQIKRPSFIAHHVSFSAIPPEWVRSSRFRALYGAELEKVNQRTFSIFFKESGWPTRGDEDEAIRYRRYFGYATFASESKPDADRVVRGLELTSPGASYEEAYDIAYAAAIKTLGLRRKTEDSSVIDGDRAAAQLRLLGFRLLRMNEFLNL